MTCLIHEGIEYVIPTIFKAMKRAWAADLIENGTICFTNLQYFANDQQPGRGDPNEGTQTLVRNGTRCSSEYTTPVYVWCCTLDTQPNRVMRTWPDKDCVIQVCHTVEFAKRIASALLNQESDMFPLQVGPVAYTKTAGGHEASDWVDGLFQKDEKYDGQKEFRFAFTAATGDAERDHVVLQLGPCKDIVRVALALNP